jgi:predicted N-acetyltransferase YhbS
MIHYLYLLYLLYAGIRIYAGNKEICPDYESTTKQTDMSAIRIRLAEDADNEQLQELAERCPQEGMITFFPKRTPLFNSIHRLLDPGSWHYVACKDDQIIGLVGVIHFHARIREKTFKIAYMLDLKVDQAFRSGMTAIRLVKAAMEHLLQSDADMVIVNFLKDNQRSIIFASGRGGIPEALYLGSNRIFSIIPIRHMRTDPRFDIHIPSEKDIPEMLALYKRHASRYKLAPDFNEKQLKTHLSLEGLSLSNFLLARENGTLKAVTAVWDEHVYKAFLVQKLSTGISLATAFLKLLSPFMNVPSPISLNKPLKQLSLVLHAHDDCPAALDTLFRHANNTCRGSDYTLIMFYAQEKDPMFRYVSKFTGVTVHSEMYLFARDTGIFQMLKEDPSPVLPDLSMLI